MAPVEICHNQLVTTWITFSERHCGPPRSANGGYTCGSLAAHGDGQVEVTLHLPPPLGQPLAIVTDDDQLTLLDGDQLVASARSCVVDLEVPEPVSFAVASEVAESSRYYDLDWHAFPNCFTCGPRRDAGDGLRIFPGAIAGTELYAAPWQPAEVDVATLWAALDCPSSAPVLDGDGGVVVLGRMAARIDVFPAVGDDLVIMSWSSHREGRKHFSASALYDNSGRCLARAKATWIALSSAQAAQHQDLSVVG
jgi:hypothetical protein